MELWSCGAVELWSCGAVELWSCGAVELCKIQASSLNLVRKQWNGKWDVSFSGRHDCAHTRVYQQATRQKMASSEESVGEFWERQVSEVVIKGGFVGVLGSKAVGFSGDQF